MTPDDDDNGQELRGRYKGGSHNDPYTGGNPYNFNGHKPNAEDYKELQNEILRQRNRRDASRFLSNEGWEPPDQGRSLYEARLHPPEPVRHIISGLLPEGISMLAAQFKAGKTTLGLNMAASLASGFPFLNYSEFQVDELSGNVGYWNLEVDEPQMYMWQDLIIKEDDDRVYTANLRGKRMDLLHERTAEWTIRWLAEREIEVWFIDPLGRMLDDENSAPEFNRWFRGLEQVVQSAGVRATLIIHHSGHVDSGDDQIPRARGSSAMLGNTDANLNYRHGGDLGSTPPDSRRYLSAFGRGVDVKELTVDYDAGNGELFVDDSAVGRSEARLERLIDKVVEAVDNAGPWVLNNGGIRSAIGGSGRDHGPAIAAALRDGQIISMQKGNSIVYAIPNKKKV